jgi:hypothetical protein
MIYIRYISENSFYHIANSTLTTHNFTLHIFPRHSHYEDESKYDIHKQVS